MLLHLSHFSTCHYNIHQHICFIFTTALRLGVYCREISVGFDFGSILVPKFHDLILLPLAHDYVTFHMLILLHSGVNLNFIMFPNVQFLCRSRHANMIHCSLSVYSFLKLFSFFLFVIFLLHGILFIVLDCSLLLFPTRFRLSYLLAFVKITCIL
jgi:hypothetical protein